MENTWIQLKDKKPPREEWVLTYRYDKDYEMDQFDMLYYCKEGDVLPDQYDTRATEDGFYCTATVDGEVVCWRHADIITHWQILRKPSKVRVIEQQIIFNQYGKNCTQITNVGVMNLEI